MLVMATIRILLVGDQFNDVHWYKRWESLIKLKNGVLFVVKGEKEGQARGKDYG